MLGAREGLLSDLIESARTIVDGSLFREHLTKPGFQVPQGLLAILLPELIERLFQLPHCLLQLLDGSFLAGDSLVRSRGIERFRRVLHLLMRLIEAWLSWL